jgi:hypothetical protein
MYYIKKIRSQGIHVYCLQDKKEYPIAVMRWSDGLNSAVEDAIQKDAERIVACLNYCEGISTEALLAYKKGKEDIILTEQEKKYASRY